MSARPRTRARRGPGRPSGTRDTPARCLRAASIEFAEHGFAAARLADIARRAGIRRPSLLHHFGSKEGLYEALVHEVFAELAVGLRDALTATGDPADLVGRAAATFDDFLAERPDVARLVLRELLDARGPGRALLLAEVVPVLDEVEGLLAAAGAGRTGVPRRAALMQIVSAGLVRVGAGDLAEPLFGASESRAEDSARLARALLVKEIE